VVRGVVEAASDREDDLLIMPVEYGGSTPSAGPAARPQPEEQQQQEQAREVADEPAVGLPLPEAPSLAEQEQHRLTHLGQQPWCDVCVRARGRADEHRARERIEKQTDPIDEVPVVEADYMFMEGIKILAIYARERGYGAGTMLVTKGPEDYVVRWMLRHLDLMAVVDVILQSDPESAMTAVLAQVRARRQLPTQIRETPRRSPQSSGAVSRYQRVLQEQSGLHSWSSSGGSASRCPPLFRWLRGWFATRRGSCFGMRW